MVKIAVSEEVEVALGAAFPAPINTAKRALAKYVQTLQKLLHQAMLYGQTPAQRKLGLYSLSLQRLANNGGQIGPKRMRVHAWLRENGFELVQTVTQGSNLTGKLSEVKLTHWVKVTEEVCFENVEEDSLEHYVEKFEQSKYLDQKGRLEDYDLLKVNQASLRSYIDWLMEKADKLTATEKTNYLYQARAIWATANKNDGWYLQRKKPSVFGRTYYEGISIQNVNKELRRAMLGDCWEYDIRSSVIAWKMGFAHSYLEMTGSSQSVREAFQTTTCYLEDKADFMRTARHFVFFDGSNVPKELQTKLLKQAITAISFGARATSKGWIDMAGEWTNPALVDIIKNPEERARFLGDSLIRQFIAEQNLLDSFIFDEFKREAGSYFSSPHLLTPGGRVSKSKVLAFYYQHSETEVMNCVRAAAQRQGHEPLACIHDAVIFRKKLGVDLKTEIEFEMRKQTGNPYWRLGALQLQGYNYVSRNAQTIAADDDCLPLQVQSFFAENFNHFDDRGGYAI